MAEKPKQSGLVRVGDTPLLKVLGKEAPPLTRAHEKLLDTAVTVQLDLDEYEVAYMARELVQCTLPHSNPGDVPVWTCTNENITLVYRAYRL
jgi:hypothetical protein